MMAWTCSGYSNDELVDKLCAADILKSERIKTAMKATDRKYYVRHGYAAYQDSPQPIGFEATISAPHMHAHALEYLLPTLKPGASVLDVGCGSGYLMGILHELVQPGGKAVGIDHIKGLTDLSRANLAKDPKHAAPLASGDIEIVTGDGRQGYPPAAPYDAIHVGAASPVYPEKLVEQLKPGGLMFVPIGEEEQTVWLISKDADGRVDEEKLFGVRYVPLTDAPSQ